MAREWIRRRSYDDAIDRWEVGEAHPADELRGLVSHYSVYREEVTSFSARQELATTSGVLIFTLGDPLEVVGADGRAILLRQGDGFAGAASDRTSISRGSGMQAGIHIFMPLPSLAAVLGVPLAALANCVATMRDIVGNFADELGTRLLEANEDEARFRILDQFLARRFADCSFDETASWSIARLSLASAPVSSELADEIGWSRRHFARRFRDSTGFSPDRFRRIARFQRFLAKLKRAPGDDLASLAAETGFADQAHLARDVRDFADMTPGELRSRLIPGEYGVRDE